MGADRSPARQLPRAGSRRRRAGSATLAIGASLVFLTPAPAPAENEFVPGSAGAAAVVGRLVVRASGLPLATTVGGALARYQGETARAQAAALDLGALGVVLTTPFCEGAAMEPDQLPQPTVADSGRGDEPASKEVAGTGGVVAGKEEASADPGPHSAAAFTTSGADLGGLVVVRDGRSASTTRLVPGQERRASAEVRFGNIDLAGGLVKLRGLLWEAEHRTGPGGAGLASTGSFGLDGMEVAGLPLPTATPIDLHRSLGSANEALAPFGLSLQAPVVTETGEGRRVRVSPLKVAIGDATATQPIVAPVVTGLLPVREGLLALLDSWPGSGCDPGSAGGLAFTAVDLFAGALEGAGGIDVELGGVSAETDGTDYGDPLGLVPPGVGSVAPAPTVARSRPSVQQPAPDLPAPAAALPAPPRERPAAGDEVGVAMPAPPRPTAAVVAMAPATRRCESTSAGGRSRCSRGSPVVASGLAIGIALTLLGGDFVKSRHRTGEEAR
jgi:hypothetical protein